MITKAADDSTIPSDTEKVKLSLPDQLISGVYVTTFPLRITLPHEGFDVRT